MMGTYNFTYNASAKKELKGKVKQLAIKYCTLFTDFEAVVVTSAIALATWVARYALP
jgi:hypothetical protein